jgi:hypothetical protein
MTPPDPDLADLSQRELLIAKAAAKLAVEEITSSFYKEVGKTVVTRILIWIGIAVTAYAAGRGWLTKG